MYTRTFESHCEYCDDVTYWADENGTSVCQTCAASTEMLREYFNL